MLTTTETKYYTPEEYLALEETSEVKNEYRQGEIIPMVGATTNHNQICLNFCRNFPLNINNQDYYTYMETILIEQSSYSVERYYKQKDDQWLIDFVTGENAVLQLVSVDWQISFQDLYQRVNFDLAET